MQIKFEDNTSISFKNDDNDIFYEGFNNNLFLRDSCGSCKYCGTQRVADITAADFWGCPEDMVTPENLKKGISLLMLNSPKGKTLISALEQYLVITPIEPKLAIDNNLALRHSGKVHKKRGYFFKKVDKMDYDRLLNKIFWREHLKRDIKNKVRKMLGEKNYLRIKQKIKGSK